MSNPKLSVPEVSEHEPETVGPVREFEPGFKEVRRHHNLYLSL